MSNYNNKIFMFIKFVVIVVIVICMNYFIIPTNVPKIFHHIIYHYDVISTQKFISLLLWRLVFSLKFQSNTGIQIVITYYNRY